jgi:hypothetical protein
MHRGLKNGPFVPHNLTPVQGSPVPLPNFQMAPRFRLLTSSGSKEEEARCVCLSEAKASHSQRVWAEVSSSAPHLLHKRLLVSLINPLNAELNTICHSLILLGDLTFMGPCIVSIFQYISNKMQRYATHSTLKPVPTIPR